VADHGFCSSGTRLMIPNNLPCDSSDLNSITHLLRRVAVGDERARQELFHAVYTDLRRMARQRMRRERRDHTLQPTALVHEAAARMLQADSLTQLANRRALYAFAAQTMHAVLVDYARQRAAQKRPSPRCRRQVALDEMLVQFEATEKIRVLALEEALEQLRARSVRQSEIVILHFYGGMRFHEIAQHLGVSLSTVEKDWSFARSWLLTKIGDT